MGVSYTGKEGSWGVGGAKGRKFGKKIQRPEPPRVREVRWGPQPASARKSRLTSVIPGPKSAEQHSQRGTIRALVGGQSNLKNQVRRQPPRVLLEEAPGTCQSTRTQKHISQFSAFPFTDNNMQRQTHTSETGIPAMRHSQKRQGSRDPCP